VYKTLTTGPGVYPGIGGPDALKIYRRGQRMFWLSSPKMTQCLFRLPFPKNVTFLDSKLLLDNSARFTSSRMKDLCQNCKVRLIFRGAYRLSGTRKSLT